MILNIRYGDHYWMTEFDMNCDQTEGGWFELKMLLSNYSPNGGWECKLIVSLLSTVTISLCTVPPPQWRCFCWRPFMLRTYVSVKILIYVDKCLFADDINQGTCTGNQGGSAPYSSNNHMARCGFVNVFTFSGSDCEINTI